MIDQIISLIMAEDWLADDLHYNSFGNGFYCKHILADRIRDFGSSVDDLKEAYYLGQTESTPPNGTVYASRASEIYLNAVEKEPDICRRLKNVLSLIVDSVEEAKKDVTLKSGVVAILDGISQKALTYKFLVNSESQT